MSVVGTEKTADSWEEFLGVFRMSGKRRDYHAGCTRSYHRKGLRYHSTYRLGCVGVSGRPISEEQNVGKVRTMPAGQLGLTAGLIS